MRYNYAAPLMMTMSLLAQTLWAIPTSVNYQGTLKDNGMPVTGNRDMTFQLYSQDGNTTYSNAITSQVYVTNGLFSLPLNFQLVAPYTWDAITPYLKISVDGQSLSPLEPLNAAIYSIVSNSIVDNAVTTTKIADKNVTAAKLEPGVQNAIASPGVIVAFGGQTPPAGWLLCDGSAVSRTGYPNLFAVIGGVWGMGDGVNTFNLPDLRGRAVIGAGQGSGLSRRILGTENIGEEIHQLTVAEIPMNLTVNDPGHAHGVNDPGHAHFLATNLKASLTAGSGGGLPTGPGTSGALSTSANQTGISVRSATTGITGGGGGAAHNVMQPSAVVNYIIKT